eukprot:s788_g12.t1
MFGLVTDHGGFMRKRSGFLTNNLTIAQHLNSHCDQSHQHELVMGRDRGSPMNRSRLAQKYPSGLVNAILLAYASSIGIAHSLLYMIDGSKMLQSDAAFENHLLLDGVIYHGQNFYDLTSQVAASEAYPLDETTERKENFPGTHPLSLEALVKRAHDGLGHPGRERFLRILANSKASPKVMEIARGLKCSVCEKFKLPRPSRAAAPPREIGLNELIGVDTIQLRAPFSNKTKYCINIVDYSSHFQLVVPLTAHTAEATRVGYRLWLKIFGAPRKLHCDLGREFQKQFETLAEADGSELLPSSLETPEQRGFVERHGQLFKEVFYKTIEQTKCSTWDEWYQTVDLACSTKNRLSSRGGYSPAQRVFGYQQRIPGGLMSDGEGDLAVQSLAAAGDVNVTRAMMIRKAASQAFHEVDCQQAVRAAATHGPRPHYAYEAGQAVYFWRRGTDAARKPAIYFWHGPARVVATQLPSTVWLSYNHHLVKASPEKIRPASEEEFFSISGWLEGISNAKKQFENNNIKGLIDLSKENDDLPPAEPQDFWRREGNFWIRVHEHPRRELFRPDQDLSTLPVQLDQLLPWRKTIMAITDGDQEILEDEWTHGSDYPSHGHEWTGETWFEEKTIEEPKTGIKRPADPLVPKTRICQKARVESEQMIPLSQAPKVAMTVPTLPTPTPMEIEVGAPPGLPQPEPVQPESIAPPSDAPDPKDLQLPATSLEPEPPVEDRKREFGEVAQTEGTWEELPVSKKSRLELLEVYFMAVSNKSAARQKKGKESTMKDFQGRDRERLLRAIQKEFNNNLSTGAYELLSPQESARIRAVSPDKIMKSRYVLTKKPIEDFALEDAISADEVLDSSEKDQPAKAKCRHVMQGYSESALLDLETSTPQVHRDSVIFAAQIMASMSWIPGFADFTQAFHSGDPIVRELYAEQPAEGLPTAERGQLLRLKKTCYGLTDGPYAWFKHIVNYICNELGYRQSVVDPCLFFLDSEPDSQGQSQIEGIIALATDDLFHGGSERHVALMEQIRQRYKLGKFTWREGRFVGKDIRLLPDGSITLDQQFYTEARVAPIQISRDRKKRRFSVCTPEEIEQLRALAFPRPLIRDLINANQIAKEALEFKHLGIRAMPIPLSRLSRLHAGVVTDASWGNSKEFGSYLETNATNDWWEETESSWIHHHVDARTTGFHPAACADGPDIHHLLLPERLTEICTSQKSTPTQDTWTTSDSLRSMSSTPWTGRTTFYKQPEGNFLDSKDIHAGYDQLNKLFSQGGEIVMFYDEDLPKSQTLQNVSLASWKSYRLKRRTVNTLSSETQALVRGLSSVHWYRVLILEAKGLHLSAREWHREVAQLPFICVTDSKSLYDTICKCTNPASQCEDKRTSIDISLIKQEISELNGTIRWIDGRTMLADSLTKETKSDLLRHVMKTGQWSILEEGSALQQKLLERTSRHEDWPRLPTILNQNQMVFNTLSLKGNTQYGFRARCDVPDFNPVNSANSFFIEFGYKSSVIQQRRFANVVEAPSIAALTNAEVYSSTNLVNYADNRIEFAVQTVTTLTANTGIVVKGSDLTTGFTFTCPDTLVALPESAPFPTDLICVYQVASDGAPQITLKVNNINMPPGYYRWEMTAQNPPTRKQDPGLWTFGTYLAASDYPTTPVLDKELQAVGFRIDNMMRDARLTALTQVQRAATNRNDRPGKSNQLIFQFSLNIRPLANRILILRGPRGFVFDDNCLPYVITDQNMVFGPNTQDVWPPDYSVWPPEYRPTKCTGVGREAQITIPSGLGRYSLYVFRIGVRSNPPSTPDWNKWSMNFNDESSDPFQGFTVWTFTNMAVTAVGAMKTPRAGIPRTATPVTIVFTPFNTVPAKPPNEQYGGMIRLTVPVEYEIQHQNDNMKTCEVQLFISDRSEIFESTDYVCQVENTVKQLLYMAGDKTVRGAFSYTLIVWVFNPPTSTLAATWRMDTFQRFSAEPDTALDETEFLGYNVNNMLNIFQVVNTNSVLNGNTKINDVDILLQFPDPMKDGDEILVTGPKDFNLIGNPELANCNEFRWVGGVQLPVTGEPGCTCDLQNFCTIRWVIDESKDPAYPQNQDLHFKVGTTNPSKTPFLTDNYWKVAHMKGNVVKSSHIFQGWSVNPQLENVDLRLVGTKYAAGKISDIEVKFTPITDADTLKIEAIFPTQFNFDQSTVWALRGAKTAWTLQLVKW